MRLRSARRVAPPQCWIRSTPKREPTSGVVEAWEPPSPGLGAGAGRPGGGGTSEFAVGLRAYITTGMRSFGQQVCGRGGARSDADTSPGTGQADHSRSYSYQQPCSYSSPCSYSPPCS